MRTQGEILTERDLENLGFSRIRDSRYINDNQWLLQVSEHCVDIENGEVINRDGTWFDGVGTLSFQRNGAMAVNTLCRGNYVCRSVRTVEDLQLLYLALTGNKLVYQDHEIEKLN